MARLKILEVWQRGPLGAFQNGEAEVDFEWEDDAKGFEAAGAGTVFARAAFVSPADTSETAPVLEIVIRSLAIASTK